MKGVRQSKPASQKGRKMNKNDLIRLRTKIITMLAALETTTESVRAALKESSEVTPSFLQDECDSAKAELDLKNALEIHKHSTSDQ